MKPFNSFGKFLATADRQSWIDITRASSFHMQERDVSEADVKAAFTLPFDKISSVWMVYCNYEKNSDPVAIFSTDDEARSQTEIMLITAFGKSQNVEQSSNHRDTGFPAPPSPRPTAN